MASKALKPDRAALAVQTTAALKEALDRLKKAVRELDSEVGIFSDRSLKDAVKLYKTVTVPDYEKRIANVLALQPGTDPYNEFWNDNTRIRKVLESAELAGDQVRATMDKAKIRFWDGFWEGLAKRYMEMWNNAADTARKLVDYLPWIVTGVVVVAAFPLITKLAQKASQAPALQGYRRRRYY